MTHLMSVDIDIDYIIDEVPLNELLDGRDLAEVLEIYGEEERLKAFKAEPFGEGITRLFELHYAEIRSDASGLTCAICETRYPCDTIEVVQAMERTLP